jgi:methionine-rich copper-binding protein CopC
MIRHALFRMAPLVALTLAASAFTGVWFHARLVRAEPGINGVVKEAPKAVQFWFNQRVTPRLTSATVLTMDSTRVAAVTFAATADSLSVAGPLAATVTPGRYRVQWRTMSADGHPIRGEYFFTFTP